MTEQIAIGKTNIDGFSRKKYFKLKPNEPNEFRLLPPLGKLAAAGKWEVGVAVHWGYVDSNKRFRPFQCVEKVEWTKDKKKIVVQECPRCKKNEPFQLMYEKKYAEMKEAGVGTEVRTEKLKHVKAYLDQFNRSFRYYANAMNANGEIGQLNYSSRHEKLLRIQLKAFEKKGIDALAPEVGVFFSFFYEGQDGHTVSPVEIEQTDGSTRKKTLPLTPAIIDRLAKESFDLTDLFPVITLAQVQQLVDNEKSPDLAKLVDSIFGSADEQDSTKTAAVDPTDDMDPELAALNAAALGTPTPATPQAPAGATAAPAAPATAAVGTAKPGVAPADIKNISDADFNALFPS
jgi:hypothetical protein